MKRLLITTSTFPRNADDSISARFILDLALALRDYYEVYVLTPHSYSARGKEVINNVKVYRFRYFFILSLQALSSGNGMLHDIKKNPIAILQLPFFFISEFIAILKIVRQEKIDVINSHWIFPQGIIGAVVKRLLGLKHIVTVHAAGIFLLARFRKPGIILAHFISRHTDCFLPVSSFIANLTERLSGSWKKHKVIPMGVDINRFRPDSDKDTLRSILSLSNKFTFLFVGKFIEKKGIGVLLKACNILKNDGYDFNLLLVGGGRLKRQIKDLVSVLSLSEYARFMGVIKNKNLRSIYTASDVVVVPSIIDRGGQSEGMPVVINEAMACGIPVIASNVSGISDTVKGDFNGWFFPPGNFQELAQLMKKTMSITNMEFYIQNAIKAAKENSWEHIAQKYYSAIEEGT